MKFTGSIIEWISPQRLFRLAFHLWPGREFLVFRDQRIDRRTAFYRIQALAAGLHAAGVKQGDRVAVLLPACPEAIYAQFVNTHLGTIHMPLNPLLGERELLEILRHSQARIIITIQDWVGLHQATVLARLKPELPDLRLIVVVHTDADLIDRLPVGEEILAYPQLIAQGRRYPKAKLRLTDPALLCYTSGTTGQPKGVIHSYARNWGLSATSLLQRLKQESLQCLLLPYPPYHFAGMFGITSALLYGGKVVLMDRIDPSRMPALIQSEKVTQIGATPTIFRLLLSAVRQSTCDLSSVRRLTFSSENLSPALAQSLYEIFHCKLDNFYGSTEAHLISWTDSGDWRLACGTVGRPPPGVEVCVVDHNRQPLPLEQTGEIAVRSPQMMNGYFRDPLLTAKVLDSEEWFYTGDAGYIGEDGYLRLTGRLSDIIKRGGELVHPEEVEVFLESHPSIRQAAVIGVPNELTGEDLFAFIVLRPGHSLDMQELLHFCRGRIAAFKVPSNFRLVDRLPLTSNGKVQRYKLRESLHA